eukprot:634547-Amphidinium_carterae.2
MDHLKGVTLDWSSGGWTHNASHNGRPHWTKEVRAFVHARVFILVKINDSERKGSLPTSGRFDQPLIHNDHLECVDKINTHSRRSTLNVLIGACSLQRSNERTFCTCCVLCQHPCVTRVGLSLHPWSIRDAQSTMS